MEETSTPESLNGTFFNQTFGKLLDGIHCPKYLLNSDIPTYWLWRQYRRCAESVVPAVQRWRILEDYMVSGHQYNSFSSFWGAKTWKIFHKWKIGRINASEYFKALKTRLQMEKLLVDSTMNLITSFCDVSTKQSPYQGKSPLNLNLFSFLYNEQTQKMKLPIT